MSSTQTAPRTALARPVAAEGSNAVVSFEQMERMAAAMAKSGLFGVKSADQALSLMLIAQAEGRHPAIAAQEYHVIQGRATLKADTLLSRFQQAGGTVKWGEITDKRVEATFTHPSSGSVTLDWTMDMAKSAGLAGKDNWKAYPRAMLRSRVISEGVRTCFPGVAVGIYTPEEISDGVAEIDVTPVRENEAVRRASETVDNAISESEREDILLALRECEEMNSLHEQFAAAWGRAKKANDKDAGAAFKAAYDRRKEQLSAEVVEG
ncbi:MAG: hypothetical protein KGI82_00985 [Betaproteobacteria bacterium]|nr:hypothetical protein [Betaproteobacteria bacterium]